MRSLVRSLFVVALVVANTSAFAVVSLKNGNFSVAYVDHLFPGGAEPKVERTFNSKSSHNGFFGFGWGSDYERYLKVSADGSIVIHENGGGAVNRFVPPGLTTEKVDEAVKAIITAQSKGGAGVSGGAAESVRNRLRNDARYRNEEWERLVDRGLLKPQLPAAGTEFRSNKFGAQVLTRTANGFTRRLDSGQIETYNNAGRLVRIADRNNNFIAFTYNKTGQLETLQDNANRKMAFRFNKAGKVERITLDDGRFCEYRYDGFNLTYSKDVSGNIYQYTYSKNDRHNLIEIKYSDATTQQIGYFGLDKNENVKWVKDRDGSLTEYEYAGDGPGGSNFITSFQIKDPSGNVISKQRYEYVEKARPDGERYNYKLVTKIDDEVTTTIFNECCGLPLEVTRGNERTTYEYDTAGRLTRKATPFEVVEMEYEKRHNKLAKVSRVPKAEGSKPRITQYTYDDRGNLNFAKDSDGRGVQLLYDHTGRIKAMIDNNKRTLQFVYNESARPIEIIDPAKGKIQVRYNAAGEIIKVDSSGGRQIASDVTRSFTALLDLIRDAQVM